MQLAVALSLKNFPNKDERQLLISSISPSNKRIVFPSFIGCKVFLDEFFYPQGCFIVIVTPKIIRHLDNIIKSVVFNYVACPSSNKLELFFINLLSRVARFLLGA
jgi:hypothetical protein